jgi:UPF0042 nucleotide-binding protein
VPTLVVITGLGGSGKSHGLRSLEDLGYLCVDNLPVALIPPFAELLIRSDPSHPRGAALVVDAREGPSLRTFPQALQTLRSSPQFNVSLLFFEASDAVLLRRYSESRRPHPLSGEANSLAQAIARERQMLRELKDQADRIVDTSRLTVHQLRAWIRDNYGTADDKVLHSSVVSFGYKYGVPPDADLVLDVRFLPNPFFVSALRGLDGRDQAVRDFLEAQKDYRDFMVRIAELMEFLVPRFLREGKAYLTIAVGCTGGRHRSVVVAEELRRQLAENGFPAGVSHRDVSKE